MCRGTREGERNGDAMRETEEGTREGTREGGFDEVAEGWLRVRRTGEWGGRERDKCETERGVRGVERDLGIVEYQPLQVRGAWKVRCESLSHFHAELGLPEPERPEILPSTMIFCAHETEETMDALVTM